MQINHFFIVGDADIKYVQGTANDLPEHIWEVNRGDRKNLRPSVPKAVDIIFKNILRL